MTTLGWQARSDVARVQRRTLRILVAAQILGGIGFGAGLSVGILLAEQVTSSEGWAGVARTGTTIGAALFALPMAAIAMRFGRRISLGGGWLLAAGGAVLLVWAAQLQSGASATCVLIAGMVISGFGSAANLQSRYAATDLALPSRRSRDLSLVVWATTVGTVLGPNLGGPGEAVSRALGLQPFAGPFVIGTVMLGLAAAVFTVLRPDPLLLAQSMAKADRQASGGGQGEPPLRLRQAISAAWAIPRARTALVAICTAHSVMVGVMTMTPVHMQHHGATISLVGLTISLHVLGMFGLSPVVGLLADRLGRPVVIATGSVLMLLAVSVAGTAGDSALRVTIGLTLLGVGWSFAMVGASTMLTESVPAGIRTRVQGATDALMNACAAIGATASGPLLGTIGFGGLNVIGGVLVFVAVPLVVKQLRALPSV